MIGGSNCIFIRANGKLRSKMAKIAISQDCNLLRHFICKSLSITERVISRMFGIFVDFDNMFSLVLFTTYFQEYNKSFCPFLVSVNEKKNSHRKSNTRQVDLVIIYFWFDITICDKLILSR